MSRATEAGTRNAAPTPCSGASRDQRGDVRCDAAEERAEQEHGDAAEEDPFAAEPVAGAPADDEQRAEHDGVGGDDPRQRRRAGIAVGRLDVGERHVHDGQVERRHERAQGGDDEHRTRPP